MVATLGTAGLVSGLLLVGAYELTLPRITENRARALREAVYQVLPGASAMQRLESSPDGLVTADEGDGEAVFGGYTVDGGLVGYAIPARGSGFQDTISLLYGFDPTRDRVVGMAVLESRETPGLGDKIYKDAAFVSAFADLDVDPSVVVVQRGKKVADNEVEAITGATISSKSVVAIINAGNAQWRDQLRGAAPALQPPTPDSPSPEPSAPEAP